MLQSVTQYSQQPLWATTSIVTIVSFFFFSSCAFIVKPRSPEALFIRAWFDSDHTSTSAVRAREAVSLIICTRPTSRSSEGLWLRLECKFYTLLSEILWQELRWSACVWTVLREAAVSLKVPPREEIRDYTGVALHAFLSPPVCFTLLTPTLLFIVNAKESTRSR